MTNRCCHYTLFLKDCSLVRKQLHRSQDIPISVGPVINPERAPGCHNTPSASGNFLAYFLELCSSSGRLVYSSFAISSCRWIFNMQNNAGATFSPTTLEPKGNLLLQDPRGNNPCNSGGIRTHDRQRSIRTSNFGDHGAVPFERCFHTISEQRKLFRYDTEFITRDNPRRIQHVDCGKISDEYAEKPRIQWNDWPGTCLNSGNVRYAPLEHEEVGACIITTRAVRIYQFYYSRKCVTDFFFINLTQFMLSVFSDTHYWLSH